VALLLPTVDTLKWEVLEEVYNNSQNRGRLCTNASAEIVTVAQRLYQEEHENLVQSVAPAYSGIEGLQYAEHLRKQLALNVGGAPPEIIKRTMVESFSSFARYLPNQAFSDGEAGLFTIPVHAAIRGIGEAVESMIVPYLSPHFRDSGLFSTLRTQLEANLAAQNAQMPSVARGLPREIVNSYLHDTELQYLFDSEIPLVLDDARFEHQWVIAPSGSGKTTLLQTQIAEDLARVQRGECSIIVIDSQNQLIPKIAAVEALCSGPTARREGVGDRARPRLPAGTQRA